MGSEWQEREIGSFATVKGGKRMPAGTALVSTRTHHPYLRIVDFKNGGIDDGNLLFVPEDVFPAISRYTIKSSDVYISIVGTIGLVGQVPSHLDGANLTENAARISCTDSSVNPRYLAYFLRSSLGQRQIVAQTVGSTQPKLALFRIANISVAIPPPTEQQAIVKLLGALDDRIDLLLQTNTTLEAIAQALFKSWFVDFDPVHAKSEGREPEAMDAATAALFPSEFENSELGLIPKGWIVLPFSKLFDFTMGQSPPGSTYNTEKNGPPFFQGCTDFGDVFPSARVYCTEPKRFARAGDVLMSVRAPVGALNISASMCSIGRGLCAVRHRSNSTGLTYLYLKACVSRIEGVAGEGALFRSLSKKQLADLPVPSPSEPILSSFIAHIEPLIDRMLVASRQMKYLSGIRDTLIPRLISGKLRLPDAESAIEDAIV